MAVRGETPDLVGAGEYGATTVSVAVDGSTVRIAFGRNDQVNGRKIFTGAVLLSPEALGELKEQLAALGL
jgi:hypothetical protein